MSLRAQVESWRLKATSQSFPQVFNASGSQSMVASRTRMGKKRLLQLMNDVAQGTLQSAKYVFHYSMNSSIQVRGISHAITSFPGGDGKIVMANANTAAKEMYITSDDKLLIKPSVGLREVTMTLAGTVLGLIVPHYMICFDAFYQDGSNSMILVCQRVPYTLREYMEQFFEFEDMLLALISVACQALISFYTFASFMNMRIGDRQARNVMVTRTSSPSMDYSDSGLFPDMSEVRLRALPHVPGGVFYGRLVIIDYGQMSGPVCKNGHMQSNLENICAFGANKPKLFNHFDDQTADFNIISKIFGDCVECCNVAYSTTKRLKPILAIIEPVFKSGIQRMNTLIQSGKAVDHRRMICDVLQELVALTPN